MLYHKTQIRVNTKTPLAVTNCSFFKIKKMIKHNLPLKIILIVSTNILLQIQKRRQSLMSPSNH